MIRLVLVFACWSILTAAVPCLARTLVVRPPEDNRQSPRDSLTYRTIQQALDEAAPGDTIRLSAGVYREFVRITKSGSAELPIVLEGLVGTDAHPSAVIDPSQPAAEWRRAADFGDGVYEATLKFSPQVLQLEGRAVARVSRRNMELPEVRALFGLPADGLYKGVKGADGTRFWDGIEAIYGTIGSQTYLRLRNGNDPGASAVRVSPTGAAITLKNVSHVRIRNVTIRGAAQGLLLDGAQTHHNVVEGCRISQGDCRIMLRNGAADNILRNNELSSEYYGSEDFGAWGTSAPTATTIIRGHIYKVFKYLVGANASADHGIFVERAGPRNEISGNRIHHGLIGIQCEATSDLDVHHNSVHHMSSIGLVTFDRTENGRFHENLFYDCNIQLRIHHYNTPGDRTRREYHYLNRYWNPPGVGNHVYVHWLDRRWPAATSHPELWLYHNTFVGGDGGFVLSGWGTEHGHPRTYLVNNVFTLRRSLALPSDYFKHPQGLGSYDYNRQPNPARQAPWIGTHIGDGVNDSTFRNGDPRGFEYLEEPGEKVINLGAPFTLTERSQQPLPGMSQLCRDNNVVRVGAAQDRRDSTIDTLVEEMRRELSSR